MDIYPAVWSDPKHWARVVGALMATSKVKIASKLGLRRPENQSSLF